MRTCPGCAARTESISFTASRQCGHSKSANSTSVTGAPSGPFVGEPSMGSAFTPDGSNLDLYARLIWSSDAPSRTARASHLAAWTQAPHARFSWTHCETGTGTLGHGARNSVTNALQACRSRGVIALVSMPGSVVSLISVPDCAEGPGAGSALRALESRQPCDAPAATPSASREAIAIGDKVLLNVGVTCVPPGPARRAYHLGDGAASPRATPGGN